MEKLGPVSYFISYFLPPRTQRSKPFTSHFLKNTMPWTPLHSTRESWGSECNIKLATHAPSSCCHGDSDRIHSLVVPCVGNSVILVWEIDPVSDRARLCKDHNETGNYILMKNVFTHYIQHHWTIQGVWGSVNGQAYKEHISSNHIHLIYIFSLSAFIMQHALTSALQTCTVAVTEGSTEREKHFL